MKKLNTDMDYYNVRWQKTQVKIGCMRFSKTEIIKIIYWWVFEEDKFKHQVWYNDYEWHNIYRCSSNMSCLRIYFDFTDDIDSEEFHYFLLYAVLHWNLTEDHLQGLQNLLQ